MPLVEIRKQEFWDAVGFEAAAGSTGFKGGDHRAGGRAYLRLRALDAPEGPRAGLQVALDSGEAAAAEQVELIVAGDAEIRTLLEALRFACRTLESQLLDDVVSDAVRSRVVVD